MLSTSITNGALKDKSSTMTSSSSSSATASRMPSFETRVQEVKPNKSLINSFVLDYLVSEGYPESAQNFVVEANIQPRIDIGPIQERVEIRNLIHNGDIQSAIERINELNPQILDQDPSLHFALLRLQLIELIRICTATPDGDITPALTFAQTQLAPRAPTSPIFLQDLEQTMALLIFSPENLAPPLAALLEPSLRKSVADRVNEAIRRSQGEQAKSKLLELVRTRIWAEKKARDLKKSIPDKISFGLDSETSGAEEHEDSIMMENGGAEAMIT